MYVQQQIAECADDLNMSCTYIKMTLDTHIYSSFLMGLFYIMPQTTYDIKRRIIVIKKKRV